MLTLTTYRPRAAFDPLDRVFDARQWSTVRPGRVAAMPVDVVAHKDGFVITAQVPGLRTEDLHIEILDDTVTLRGEVPAPQPAEGEQVLLQERAFGRFSRQITLPTALNGAQAEATVENGVLTLRVPKAETARAKVIPVKTK